MNISNNIKKVEALLELEIKLTDNEFLEENILALASIKPVDLNRLDEVFCDEDEKAPITAEKFAEDLYERNELADLLSLLVSTSVFIMPTVVEYHWSQNSKYDFRNSESPLDAFYYDVMVINDHSIPVPVLLKALGITEYIVKDANYTYAEERVHTIDEIFNGEYPNLFIFALTRKY